MSGHVLRSLVLAGAVLALTAGPVAGQLPTAQASPAACPGGAIKPVAVAQATAFRVIAVLSECDAWAAGFSWNGSIYQTLIERWNGSAWRVTPSPDPGGESVSNQLTGIAAASAGGAWAVGNYDYVRGPDGFSRGFIEKWDGSKWSSERPGRRFRDSTLNSVAASSPVSAWAVGSFTSKVAGPPRTLIERWNGSAWTVVPSPNPAGSGAAELASISAVSASDAWAVGSYLPDSGKTGFQRTLIEHWNGRTWTIVRSPDFTGLHGAAGPTLLTSVAALSGKDVWAAGISPRGGGSDVQALILHWNGRTWARAAVPSAGPSQLTSVAATGPGAVWAVGFYDGGTGSTRQTLIEHWNGHAWHVSAPQFDSLDHELDAIATDGSDVWALGQVSNPVSHAFGIIARRWTA